MKKIVSILSVVFILFATTGFIANVHTCPEAITEVSFMEHTDCCVAHHDIFDIEHDEHSCCNNEPLLIKLDEDLYVPSHFKASISLTAIILKSQIICADDAETESVNLTQYQYRPPPQQDLYILFCSYIFYG